MSDNEKLMRDAAAALSKQRATIASLQARIAEHEASVGDAIQKSLNAPAQADLGRNRTVTKIMNDGIFQPRDIAKSKKSEADKRTANLRELRKAKLGHGRPSKYGKEI